MSFWPTGCFDGRTVLVVGGTSGIGTAIAKGFLEEKALVAVTGVSKAEIEKAREDMASVSAEVLDVRNDEAVRAMIGKLARLDHLVNCAGVIRRGDEHSPQVFAEVLDINLVGTMRVCAAARPLLAETGGTIVNTASMLSFF